MVASNCYYVFFIQVLHILKKDLQSPGTIGNFWCAWESTTKNLSKSQLDIGILNFEYYLFIVRLRANFC